MCRPSDVIWCGGVRVKGQRVRPQRWAFEMSYEFRLPGSHRLRASAAVRRHSATLSRQDWWVYFVYAFDDFRCFLSLQEAQPLKIKSNSFLNLFIIFYRGIVCIENYMRKATESFEISWFFRFMNIGFINLVSKNYHADSSFSFLLTIVKILSSSLFQIAKIVERKWKLSIFAISCTMC